MGWPARRIGGTQPGTRVNDTLPAAAAIVLARHREMTGEERWAAASSLFETARAIVESSLPANLPVTERRLAWARRTYGSELPDEALAAFAAYRRPE